MGQRSAAQIFADLVGAGLSQQSALTGTAIALAESGGNDTALGDTGLETPTWGASYGLYQIRTLRAQTGSGSDRDISWLAASDTNQAKAAYDISAHGADWSPWTTYVSGRYEQFLGQAQAGAAQAGAVLTGAGGGSQPPFSTWGPTWLPWNWGSDVGNATAQALGGARTIVIEALFAALGVGLLGLGAARLAGHRTHITGGAL